MLCEEKPDQYVISPFACIIEDGTHVEKSTEVIKGDFKYK
jgi:hypothetical protein